MKTRVAVGQMTSTDDKAANLACAKTIIEKAARLGARLVSLPENFAYLESEASGALAAAEEISGPTITNFKNCAKKNGIWLSLGGFQEKIPGENKIFNTHLIIDDQGQIMATYRKIHLFSVMLPDGS